MAPVISALESRQQSGAVNPASYMGNSNATSSNTPLRAGLIVCGVVVGLFIIGLSTLIFIHFQKKKARQQSAQTSPNKGSSGERVDTPNKKSKMLGWWQKREESEKSTRPASSGAGTVKTDDDIPPEQHPERGYD